MLPIQQVLGALTAALRDCSNAVLVAPPGAGKTTVAPLALLAEPWAAEGRLIVLEPRRLAARAAARRMAQSLGEPVGATVGFRVRMEARVSDATRIEVVTEGVFTRMILDDPTLEGVAGVVFDEFHERSLDADLGLAFALDAQRWLRPDLRLLVMSATLDGAAVARLLGEAAVIESAGQSFPIATRYLGRDAALRVEDEVARAVRRALADETGDVLVFLPGRAEIARVQARLVDTAGDRALRIAPLHGGLDFAEQDAAVAPAGPGERKVVLATSLAQTSLTLEGVRVVIDSGLARVPRYDPARGLTRLATVRVSRAAADQRRGRAGRTAPGVCWRLWDEAQTRALAPFDRPEILESDLAGVALALAQWGARTPAGLAFLDPPPAAAFADARRLLHDLGALDTDGDLAPHGRRMGGLGLSPRLAHMILEGGRRGWAGRAAQVAAVLSEPGLGGDEIDVSARVERLARDDGPRAHDARRLAQRWARAALASEPAAHPVTAAASDGLMLGFAYPERVARARGAPGEFRLANGRGAWLERTDALARSPWLAVGELAGAGERDRILAAAPLREDEVLGAFADRIAARTAVEIDDRGRARVRRTRRLGEIVIDDVGVERPDSSLIKDALIDHLRRCGLGRLAWREGASDLRARVAYLRAGAPGAWPDFGEAALLADLDAWFTPLLADRSSLDEVTPAELEAGLRTRLPRDLQRRLELEAPTRFPTPAGTSAPIDYAAEGGPRVEVRVQELFGMAAHPTIGPARTPLTLSLLSPARRPIQITRDLPGFWAGSWREARIEMKARYPRHPWPEDPLQAPPTTRAKPRGA